MVVSETKNAHSTTTKAPPTYLERLDASISDMNACALLCEPLVLQVTTKSFCECNQS